MKKLLQNSHGFSALEVALFVIVMGLIGGSGYYVYNEQKDNNKTTGNSGTQETKGSDQQETDAYTGWATCSDSTEDVSFKYPKAWGSCNFSAVGGNGSAILESTAAAPTNFRMRYFSGFKEGKYSGSSKPDRVVEVVPLKATFNDKALYAVMFADEWTDEGKVLTMALTDTKYEAGKTAEVVGVRSSKHSGTFITFDANLGPLGQEKGQHTVAEYKQSPDYADVLKMFESFMSK